MYYFISDRKLPITALAKFDVDLIVCAQTLATLQVKVRFYELPKVDAVLDEAVGWNQRSSSESCFN